MSAPISITTHLGKHFPTNEHKTKSQGGKRLTYVPNNRYIERLNEHLDCCWSWEIVSLDLDHVRRYAMCHGRLTVQDAQGRTWVKDGIGVGEDLTNNQKEELDKIAKTANSEALKNAAKLLGLGLYLYDDEEVAAATSVHGNNSGNGQPASGTAGTAPATTHSSARSAAST